MEKPASIDGTRDQSSPPSGCRERHGAQERVGKSATRTRGLEGAARNSSAKLQQLCYAMPCYAMLCYAMRSWLDALAFA